MAYGKRAYCTFLQFKTDFQIDVEIHQEYYGGDAEEITLGVPPILIRMKSSGNTKFDPICGTEATINIVVSSGDDYSWLFVEDDFELMVIVKVDSVEKWRGYILAGEYVEAYLPYKTITVTASDQLGLLNNQEYKFGSPPVSPEGYQKNIIILANILSQTTDSKTRIEIPIRCTDDLFEKDMDYTDVDDPMEQACATQNRWITDYGEASDCITVIEDIVKPKQCRVLQSEGKWWVQSVRNLQASGIDCRDFTNEGVYSTNSEVTLRRLVGKNVQLHADWEFRKEKGWRQRDIEVNYGLKKSLLPSYNFPDSAFTDDYTIAGWTNSGNIWGRVNTDNGNKMTASTGERTKIDLDLYLESPIASVVTIYDLTLTMETGRMVGPLINPASICPFAIILDAGGGSIWCYIHDDAVGWLWVNYFAVSTYKQLFPRIDDLSEIETQTIQITSVPADGDLYLRFYAPYKGSAWAAHEHLYFTNVQLNATFTTEAGDDVLESQTFRCEITDDCSYIPGTENIALSDCWDDTLANYYNGFMKCGILETNYTKLWARKVDMADSLAFLPLVPKSLSEYTTGWMNEGWYNQYYEANWVGRGSFSMISNSTFWFHNTLHFADFRGSGEDLVLMPIDIEIDIKANIINGTFIEIKKELTGESNPSSLTLKARGTPGAVSLIGGVTVIPGGIEGAIQFKSGADLEGTDVTWDGSRLKTGDGLPLCDYRRDTVSIAAGEVIVLFLDRDDDPYPFESGDDVAYPPMFMGITADGEQIWRAPYWDSEVEKYEGFKIDFDVPVTLMYDVMVKR